MSLKKEDLPNNIQVVLTPEAWQEVMHAMSTNKDITIQGSRLQFNGVDIPGPDGKVARIDIILTRQKELD